jgi:hypothetical protein
VFRHNARREQHEPFLLTSRSARSTSTYAKLGTLALSLRRDAVSRLRRVADNDSSQALAPATACVTGTARILDVFKAQRHIIETGPQRDDDASHAMNGRVATRTRSTEKRRGEPVHYERASALHVAN